MLATDVQDADAALWVRFFRKPVQNNFKSGQAGHPVFDDKIFISIIAPGDPNNKVERPVQESDKQRFHKQWGNFERNEADKVEGSAIEEWAAITRSQAEELKYLGVRSVEQLAAASDGQMQRIMGGHSLRDKAKAFLAQAKDSALAMQLQELAANQKREIESLRSQIAQLGAKAQETSVESGETKAIPKRRPGRPKKVATQEHVG